MRPRQLAALLSLLAGSLAGAALLGATLPRPAAAANCLVAALCKPDEPIFTAPPVEIPPPESFSLPPVPTAPPAAVAPAAPPAASAPPPPPPSFAFVTPTPKPPPAPNVEAPVQSHVIVPKSTGASATGFFIVLLIVLAVVGGGATFLLVWLR